jgi:hypothetical protein
MGTIQKNSEMKKAGRFFSSSRNQNKLTMSNSCKETYALAPFFYLDIIRQRSKEVKRSVDTLPDFLKISKQ